MYVNTNQLRLFSKLTATLLPGLEGKAADYCLSRRSLIVLIQQKTEKQLKRTSLGLFTQKKVYSRLITNYV